MRNALILFFFFCWGQLWVYGEQKFVVIPDKIQEKAAPFSLADLRLQPGSIFKNAMDKDAQWLLDLEPDRLLHRFRLNAGLKPKGDIYGGWESRGVSGHTLGHYLSACSMMYAASGNQLFKDRVDYIVEELAECQRARKTGYVGGIPEEDRIWQEVSSGNIRTQGFDLNGGWVPWYTLHKLWAGLIDAYQHTGNELAKEVVIRLTDWAVDSFEHLREAQFQNMLRSEFGGMNEVLAEVYAMTGNEAYLRLARMFYHREVLEPLKEGRDELEGKHSNTQIPKIIGQARLYELTGEHKDSVISTFFWERMVNHHSYVNGGNSNYEHLGKSDCLNDRLSAYTSETCNTYNMLKLTRHLFFWSPKDEYIEYYERALYNHILASQNPEDGMVCYSVPLKSGTEKVFSNRFDSFWCCVGTGFENHVKYAENVFAQSVSDKGLFVNLFIPTTLNWKEKGMEITMTTQFPKDSKIYISFRGERQKFPLHIRYPKWCMRGIKVYLNGKVKDIEAVPGTYFTLNEDWGNETKLVLDIPMDLYTISMPDNKNRIGIFYGPVLLAASLGDKELKEYDIPCLISDRGSEFVVKKIKEIGELPLHFQIHTASGSLLNLQPFYSVYNQKHAVYFDIFTSKEWEIKKKEYRKMIEEEKALNARTIDYFRIGEMQPEREHDLGSENSSTGQVDGVSYRDASDGWFAFDMEVDAREEVQLVCSYWGTDKGNRNFDILLDDKLFQTVSLDGSHGNRVFKETYDIPISFTHGKQKLRVRFQSHSGHIAGGLFGIRTMYKYDNK